MESFKNRIMHLRSLGMTYSQIEKELGCSKSTISYHLGEDQNRKMNDRRKRYYHSSIVYTLGKKLRHFTDKEKGNGRGAETNRKIVRIIACKIRTFHDKGEIMARNFTVEDVLEKIGDNPTCYLTGEAIDLSKSSSYSFDHILPRSCGGENTLENLGLCTSIANRSKTDMAPEDFFALCKRILEYNGYEVSPKNPMK